MFKYLITSLLLLLAICPVEGKNPPERPNGQNQARNEERATLREPCRPGISRVTQNINNVRALLLINGDCWWDGDNPQYIVPKPVGEEIGVSAIFAGAVWIGGFDEGNNLKLAAKTFGASNGDTDFWPGPINMDTLVEDDVLCNTWDKHFEILGADIDQHLRNYQEAIDANVNYEIDDIPRAILGWPARGNRYFESIHGFELPLTEAGLAGFFDSDGDDIYEPEEGDYPVIEVRGCPNVQYADQMFFWIYNDDSNVHSQSQNSLPMSMEVQVQSFAYQSNDELNNMTFQRYKLINRGTEPLDSTFFAMWVDPDLGCAFDDYIGCNVERDLAFIYNSDLVDGEVAGSCDCSGTQTYCTEIPVLGIDYFRGPLNEMGDEIGMSSFVYYNNGGATPTPPAGTTDPSQAVEFYRYLSGSWLDGAAFTEGGNGRGGATPTKYVFPGRPNVEDEWSMTQGEGLPNGDRRTLQASGPFRLTPGATNELIIGAVFVPNVAAHPKVDLTTLLFADDIAQAAFDNCFEIPDGPDAPDVDWLELDQELVFFLSNDPITSNNYQETYEEKDLRGPDDSITYVFEGYELYQLRNPGVVGIDNSDDARLVFSTDIKNGVTEVYEWLGVANAPGFEPPFLFETTIKAIGSDEGLRKSAKLTVDAFTSEPLINHKKYYYRAIAYGYNNYLDFNASTGVGQRFQYILGRKNSPVYTVIPRKVVTDKLNSNYGDGPLITRLDGEGAGETFLEITDESREAIFNETNDGKVVYEPNSSPVDVRVINPFKVVDGEYELRITDSDGDDELDSWTVTDQEGNVTNSERSISDLNEQLLRFYGFSVNIAQSDDAGDNIDSSNGTIGFTLEYADPSSPQWLTAFIDEPGGPFDYVKTESGRPGNANDPNQAFSNFSDGGLVPFQLTDSDPGLGGVGFVISPYWDANTNIENVLRGELPQLSGLNNIDIVMTSDKDKWSRCVILEAANEEYYSSLGLGLETEGGAGSLDLRRSPSVGKEAGGDGNPAPDNDTDSAGNPRIGMGWFPGYAIDVETGERLNIFFAENSVYDCSVAGIDEFCDRGSFATPPTGRDMMFNPTSEQFIAGGSNEFDVRNTYAGGQHHIYVTNEPYDRCERMYNILYENRDMTGLQGEIAQYPALTSITWAGTPAVTRGNQMLSYSDGLIPNDVIIKARVDNPYAVKEGMGTNNGDPTYLLNFEGTAATAFTERNEFDSLLAEIKVVPNPYYGFSDYEADKRSNIIKITNLPAKATVTIYTLDGRFVRRYERDEVGVAPVGRERLVDRAQIEPAIEWDLKNFENISVSSGVYLIHIDAPGIGQTVLKWFGVARQFDPTGL